MLIRVLLGLQFLLCKNWTAQARSLTEREWGNPSKVPPSHSPFLAVSGKTRCLDRREARYIRQTETDGGPLAAVRWFLTGVRPTLPYHEAVCNAREKCGFATISP